MPNTNTKRRYVPKDDWLSITIASQFERLCLPSKV